MADDYGDPSRGKSFEEVNFKSALDGMGHELIPFDFMAAKRDAGKREMNRRLIDLARRRVSAESASPNERSGGEPTYGPHVGRELAAVRLHEFLCNAQQIVTEGVICRQ